MDFFHNFFHIKFLCRALCSRKSKSRFRPLAVMISVTDSRRFCVWRGCTQLYCRTKNHHNQQVCFPYDLCPAIMNYIYTTYYWRTWVYVHCGKKPRRFRRYSTECCEEYNVHLHCPRFFSLAIAGHTKLNLDNFPL